MTSSDELPQKIQALWQKHLPTLRSRLAVVRNAIEALERGDITDELKTTAAQEGHNLAGSLGTFGLQGSSDAAVQIEILLSREGPFASADIDRFKEPLRRLERDIENR